MRWQGDAICRIYALADQPGFLDALWEAALPAALLADIMPAEQMMHAGPMSKCEMQTNTTEISLFVILSSTTPMRVPWSWLEGPFAWSAAAALNKACSREGLKCSVAISRPARQLSGRLAFQRIM